MTRCPSCGRTYAADLAFCQFDGTPLVSGADTSGTPTGTPTTTRPPTPRRVPPPPPTGSPLVPPPTPTIAPEAGGYRSPDAEAAAYAPAYDVDAAPTASQAAPYATPASAPASGPAAPISNRTAWMLVGVLALIGALGLGGYVLFLRPPELETKLYAALDQGNLVTPENYSAYELYHQLATEKPGSKALARATARVAPLLRTETTTALQTWSERSEATDEDWTRLGRLAGWNLELSAGDAHATAQDYYVRAQKAFRSGQVREARSAFQQAIEAWPEWSLPYNSLGVTFAKARDYASAAEWYQRAAERSPSWSFPHGNLGGAYYNLRRYDEAEAALLRAISIDGNRPGPYLTLAGVYERQYRYEEAINAMETALRLDANGTAGVNVSRTRQKIDEMRTYLY